MYLYPIAIDGIIWFLLLLLCNTTIKLQQINDLFWFFLHFFLAFAFKTVEFSMNSIVYARRILIEFGSTVDLMHFHLFNLEELRNLAKHLMFCWCCFVHLSKFHFSCQFVAMPNYTKLLHKSLGCSDWIFIQNAVQFNFLFSILLSFFFSSAILHTSLAFVSLKFQIQWAKSCVCVRARVPVAYKIYRNICHKVKKKLFNLKSETEILRVRARLPDDFVRSVCLYLFHSYRFSVRGGTSLFSFPVEMLNRKHF